MSFVPIVYLVQIYGPLHLSDIRWHGSRPDNIVFYHKIIDITISLITVRTTPRASRPDREVIEIMRGGSECWFENRDLFIRRIC